jgi:hypothetical protein
MKSRIGIPRMLYSMCTTLPRIVHTVFYCTRTYSSKTYHLRIDCRQLACRRQALPPRALHVPARVAYASQLSARHVTCIHPPHVHTYVRKSGSSSRVVGTGEDTPHSTVCTVPTTGSIRRYGLEKVPRARMQLQCMNTCAGRRCNEETRQAHNNHNIQ